MRIIGTGIDLVEIARLQQSLDRFGLRFVQRVFTAEERRYCELAREPARPYAARFAAKEALAKAFGTGIGAAVSWLEVEVQRNAAGCPSLRLSGAAADTAARLGIGELHLSLSHSEHHAVAQVLACGT